jgi:hypothetical protein
MVPRVVLLIMMETPGKPPSSSVEVIRPDTENSWAIDILYKLKNKASKSSDFFIPRSIKPYDN